VPDPQGADEQAGEAGLQTDHQGDHRGHNQPQLVLRIEGAVVGDVPVQQRDGPSTPAGRPGTPFPTDPKPTIKVDTEATGTAAEPGATAPDSAGVAGPATAAVTD